MLPDGVEGELGITSLTKEAFPIIHYLESKGLEVQNLRLLVRGKAVDLPEEVIEAHMSF